MNIRNSYPSIKAPKYLIYSGDFPEIRNAPELEKLKSFEFSPRRLKSSKSPQVSKNIFIESPTLSTESSDWGPEDVQGSFDFTQTSPDPDPPDSQYAVAPQMLPRSSLYNSPLSIIHETSFEDKKKRPKNKAHKSQQPLTIHKVDKSSFPYNSPSKRHKFSQKLLSSPYSPSKLSQSRLPTLKISGKTSKIAKKFKDLINNKHAV